mmetsp:Transcript_103197/g.205065  ORF Transcript_103197/g.205065 Transcript_103197/m.205065 type:complete len:254 (-) Transcript_103197:42-803(-)|eukprot:CAMPEP_0172722398 /NCGR_PEP_ID=MMETSP1074-20121228/81365_1 /TAXON_ID=2916 /ORGANISM="Ceratium fusus, Strain PA161109" /LENGTH=253 /DNA_ID=CAMNT_0013548393 /DNA_START=19 /DNA_END=780 /DNA_ORIENTATION=+
MLWHFRMHHQNRSPWMCNGRSSQLAAAVRAFTAWTVLSAAAAAEANSGAGCQAMITSPCTIPAGSQGQPACVGEQSGRALLNVPLASRSLNSGATDDDGEAKEQSVKGQDHLPGCRRLSLQIKGADNLPEGDWVGGSDPTYLVQLDKQERNPWSNGERKPYYAYMKQETDFLSDTSNPRWTDNATELGEFCPGDTIKILMQDFDHSAQRNDDLGSCVIKASDVSTVLGDGGRFNRTLPLTRGGTVDVEVAAYA